MGNNIIIFMIDKNSRHVKNGGCFCLGEPGLELEKYLTLLSSKKFGKALYANMRRDTLVQCMKFMATLLERSITRMYTSIYSRDIPPLITQLLKTTAMQRLSGVGMHCGCEYAKFPIYTQARGTYSRYTHSIGVAKIVWKFTNDIKQTVAGLLHDIATPVFAHTIDFMNDDHLEQESTESKTRLFIEGSREIMSLLDANNIHVDEVDNYHLYPIADNDTPNLSADRLEYTLGNGCLVHNIELSDIQNIYDDIVVVENEKNEQELCFRSMEMARAFTFISLENSQWFVSDEDRFAMQYLADLIRKALRSNVIAADDLFSTENAVIKKIKNNQEVCQLWERYADISAVDASMERLNDIYCVNVSAKKRYINPLVLVGQTPKRITDVDNEIKDRTESFLSSDFDRWVFAK